MAPKSTNTSIRMGELATISCPAIAEIVDRLVADATREIDRDATWSHVSYAQAYLDPVTMRVRDYRNAKMLPRETQEWLALHALHQMGNTTTEFDQALAFALARVVEVGEGCSSEFRAGRPLSGVTLLRATVEHASVLVHLCRKLSAHLAITKPANSVAYVTKIEEILAVAVFGTRFNWPQNINSDDLATLERKEREYTKDENGLNLRAQVMDAIDSADAECPGFRAAYEILCEFAHPNIGATWLVNDVPVQHVDSMGIQWIARRLRSQSPDVAVPHAFGAAVRVVDSCLLRFRDWVEQYRGYRPRVLQAVQFAVRTTGRSALALLNPYDPCPCGSGAKAKFCCRAPKIEH
ncbi:MAG: hypothetical protein A3G26_09685 [Betaproteobacteria bacterium RIFCSPLOWO2_12_FULL_65_110]|nr:MAG: hypothetical protein A3G26_09685 [Betaproteobacteria bacterium RIFCSPLOWO2_12_FULL_65_110]